MPYIMIWFVDGGCRGNGTSDAKGGAAAIRSTRTQNLLYTRMLPYDGVPHTNQRAELLAIVMALRESWNLYRSLGSTPALEVTIHSDSQYAVSCLTVWIQRWIETGFVNAQGHAVADQDLIREAYDSAQELRTVGSVTFQWIGREQNRMADAECQKLLDGM